MRTSFFEINVAMSGLFVAKNGLSVTSHNIANAANRGYSRQVALQRSSTPLALYTGKGMVGTGAEIYGVGQIRSFFLDQKYWEKNHTLGEFQVKGQLLTMTEAIFNPLSDTGINAVFNDFFNTLQDLTTSSHDETYRGNVLQTAQTLATYINSTYENLSKQQGDINTEVEATVRTINSLGTQIKQLNDQIIKYEFGGDSANDLRDQRALLVDELSKYVNLSVTEVDKEFSVQIDGNDFVKGTEIRTLEVRVRTEKANPDDVHGLYDIFWSRSGAKFNMYSPTLSGELRALLDMRDGNNGDNFVGTVTSINDLVDPAQIPIATIATTATPGNFDVSITNFTSDMIDPITNQLRLLNKDTGNFEFFDIVDTPDTSSNPATITINAPNATSAVEFINTFSGGQVNEDRFSITIENYSKSDILQSGKISLPDPRTGLNVDFTYSSFEVDPVTGAITFLLTDMSRDDYAKFSASLVNNPITATSADMSDFKGIPYYLQRLNNMVRTFARAINEGVDHKGDQIPGVIGHVDGYDLNNENNGHLLFTYTDEHGKEVLTGPLDSYDGMTARNFSVSDFLKKNPQYLAASTEADSGESNNEVILSFLNVKSYNSLFREGKIEDYSIAISTEIGIDLKQAEHFAKSYNDVVLAADNQRLSVMSVDIDEEGMNMVRYQQLYQASAKLISVIDALYDTLINRLGA